MCEIYHRKGLSLKITGKQETIQKNWKVANMIYTIKASQKVKIPGQMVKFLDNLGNSGWLAGMQ